MPKDLVVRWKLHIQEILRYAQNNKICDVASKAEQAKTFPVGEGGGEAVGREFIVKKYKQEIKDKNYR